MCLAPEVAAAVAEKGPHEWPFRAPVDALSAAY